MRKLEVRCCCNAAKLIGWVVVRDSDLHGPGTLPLPLALPSLSPYGPGTMAGPLGQGAAASDPLPQAAAVPVQPRLALSVDRYWPPVAGAASYLAVKADHTRVDDLRQLGDRFIENTEGAT